PRNLEPGEEPDAEGEEHHQEGHGVQPRLGQEAPDQPVDGRAEKRKKRDEVQPGDFHSTPQNLSVSNSSTLTELRLRKTAITMARPTAASAAATAMTKKTAVWPLKKPAWVGALFTSGKREKVRKVRFTALSISSMLMSTMSALRRSTTPTPPSAKSAAPRNR